MKLLRSLKFVFAAFLASAACLNAAPDDDNAARPPYDDGWQDGDDGSTNPQSLGGWVFGGGAGSATATIDSSLGNGGASSIDTAGEAFRLLDTANSGAFIEVFRFIDPAGLAVGETFSLSLDVNFRSGFKGIRIRGADTAAIFRFEIGNVGAGDDYTVFDAATNNGSIGNAYSDNTQFSIALTQTSGTGGTWSITRSGGIADSDTGTYSGVVSSFQLYTVGAGNDPNQAIYYNNFAVVPEPSTWAMLLIGAGACAVFRRNLRKA